MKTTLAGLMTIFFSTLLTMFAISPAQASMQKLGAITCQDFVAMDDVVKPKIVYWTEGFNKKGNPDDEVVDVDETDKLVPVLVTDCKASPKQPFVTAVKSAHDRAAKAKASATKAQ